MQDWFESDVIGVPVTVLASAVFLLSVAAVLVAGPLAGIVFSMPALVLIIYLIRSGEPSDLAGISKPPPGGHGVLVVADRGLENPALAEQVTHGDHATEVMIVVPVTGNSRLHRLADDIDVESRSSVERMDRAIATLTAKGIAAHGQIDEAGDPEQALLDGLREFPANEVVIIPDDNPGWLAAEALADRVRSEVGVPVTQIDVA